MLSVAVATVACRSKAAREAPYDTPARSFSPGSGQVLAPTSAVGHGGVATAAITKITVWFVVAAVALIFASNARKETVSGYLTPTAGTAQIHTLQPGIVGARL